MNEDFNIKNGNEKKPPCKSYDSNAMLFGDLILNIRNAQECVLRLAKRDILPKLRYRFKGGLDSYQIEDGFITGMAKFLLSVNAGKYTKITLALIWTFCYRAVINITRENNIDFIPIDNDITQGAETFIDIIDENEVNYYMSKFKERLTDSELEVFELKYEDGKTPKEIIEITGKSKNSIYRILEEIEKKIQKFADDLRNGKIQNI